MKNERPTSWLAGVLGAALLVSADAGAVPIGGIEFPQGTASFADAVTEYDPAFGGGAVPNAANGEPSNALGVPEAPGGTSVQPCSGPPLDCPFVSLGSGGRITLEFVDNRLTGSDDGELDLWIFEVGPDIEDTFVEISADGFAWFDVGKVFGTTGGIDIDAFGFGSSDAFRFVRLRDDPAEGSTGGISVGADIDAVGAISTLTVPEPPALELLLTGLAVLSLLRRRGPGQLMRS